MNRVMAVFAFLAVLMAVSVAECLDVRLMDGTYAECPARCEIVSLWDEFYECNSDKTDLMFMRKYRMTYRDWRDVFLNGDGWVWEYMD